MDKIISSFIDSVIEQKKLQFSKNETDFDNLLFEKNILKIENDKISIIDYHLISSQFLDKYIEKFDFKISKEFQVNVDFINKIKKDFLTNGYVHDYHILEKEIWKLVTKESNSKFNCSFNDYLSSVSLDKKPEGLFSFIDAYSNLLPELDLTDVIIFDNALILTEITKSDAQYNIPLGNVLNGIKNKCKSNYDLGLELLKKSFSVNEEKESIISAIVSGLYENKKIEFYDSILKDLIQKGNKLNSIFFGLSNVSKIEITECDLYIEIIKKYIKKDSLVISILSLIFSILKSNNTKYHKFCFKELESAIENEKTAYYILNNLDQLNNYSQQKTKIVIKLINQNYFSIDKYINPINNVFWHLKEFESFKKIVLSIIENKPFENFIKSFQSYLHTVDKIELDKFTIELLTDNQASKRNIGIDIFNQLSSYSPYKFTFNILELSHILQYKLWMSLTQDFHEPKNRLVALLPLIDSNSDLIKESFICKLEEISEDYGGHVTNVIDNNLDKDIPEYTNVIERVKNYIEDYYAKNIDLKNSVPELNPYHTHYKFIKAFDESFSKNMSKSVGKGARENSLLSILGTSTVQLSKGGGWRFGAKKEISQLGKVGTSFTMPRGYFINPNKFELEKGFLVRQDWKDEEFLEIKTFLEDE
ncbi:hypothetical protein SAMN04488096_1154 [Mesonia phycicola]|uniref:Uncharacterized protein n=2 Tax=Mesonia phycicola TaxID=579105 RepID=A0A1M6HMM5_9FLAO|nr:hypothetical protein SAMN04488096_1154 [Mesonia phycicola]